MKKIFFLLAFFSLFSEGAIITTGVSMGPGNIPTVNFMSSGATAPSGNLMASGMYYFGIGTIVVRKSNGDPSPWAEPYGGLLGINKGAISLSNGDDWAKAVEKFIAKYGSSGALTSGTNLNTVYEYQACAFASQCSNCGTSYLTIYPGSCSTIPWNPVSCNIRDSSLLIDHGTLALGEVNGHSASTTTEVRCSSNAIVRFRISDSRTYLGNNISSDIYVNGRGFGGSWGDMNYTVPNWGLPVTVESRLVSSNPQPGPFSGSVVLILDVM